MDEARIAELLAPFFAPPPSDTREPAPLTESQFKQISTYINILLRWNARINLTAVRRPEEIVTRHFGESLFAARQLFPAPPAAARTDRVHPPHPSSNPPARPQVTDVGSGAGFPGLPIKIWAREICLTLIESNQKKATFLREAARALTLTDVNVFAGRAQDFLALARSPRESAACPSSSSADLVTLRAVEHFDRILPIAASLLAPSARLALLIGESQVCRAHELLPSVNWSIPMPIPLSDHRVLIIGGTRKKT